MEKQTILNQNLLNDLSLFSLKFDEEIEHWTSPVPRIGKSYTNLMTSKGEEWSVYIKQISTSEKLCA